MCFGTLYIGIVLFDKKSNIFIYKTKPIIFLTALTS